MARLVKVVVALALALLLVSRPALGGVRSKLRVLKQRVTTLEQTVEIEGDPEGVVVVDADEEFIGVPQIVTPNGGFHVLTFLESGTWVLLEFLNTETVAPLRVVWDEPTCTGDRYVPFAPPPAAPFYVPAGVHDGEVEVANTAAGVTVIDPTYFAGSGFGCVNGCCESVDFPETEVIPVKTLGSWPFEAPYRLDVED